MEDFILHRSPINEFYANCENKELFERKTCDVLLAIVNLFDKIKIHVHNCTRLASNLIDTEVSYRKNGLTNTNLESIFDLSSPCWLYIFASLPDSNPREPYPKAKAKTPEHHVVRILDTARHISQRST